MIAHDSPLRRLPTQLNARQAMYCDGVRYAVEMIDVAYRRLVAGLEEVAAENLPEAGNMPGLFLDAWSVVDHANRLRVLLDVFPGIKKNGPRHQVLMRHLKSVEPLRNSVQHLPGDIQKNPAGEVPAWGLLHWVRIDSEKSGRIFLAVPGSARSMSNLGRIQSPGGRAFASNPDFVTLEAYGAELNLSDLHRVVAEWLQHFEDALAAEFEPSPERTGSDLVVTIDFEAQDAPTPP